MLVSKQCFVIYISVLCKEIEKVSHCKLTFNCFFASDWKLFRNIAHAFNFWMFRYLWIFIWQFFNRIHTILFLFQPINLNILFDSVFRKFRLIVGIQIVINKNILITWLLYTTIFKVLKTLFVLNGWFAK